MNISELLKEVIEENIIRKILLMIKDCKNIEEAIKKIEALLEK